MNDILLEYLPIQDLINIIYKKVHEIKYHKCMKELLLVERYFVKTTFYKGNNETVIENIFAKMSCHLITDIDNLTHIIYEDSIEDSDGEEIDEEDYEFFIEDLLNF